MREFKGISVQAWTGC